MWLNWAEDRVTFPSGIGSSQLTAGMLDVDGKDVTGCADTLAAAVLEAADLREPFFDLEVCDPSLDPGGDAKGVTCFDTEMCSVREADDTVETTDAAAFTRLTPAPHSARTCVLKR